MTNQFKMHAGRVPRVFNRIARIAIDPLTVSRVTLEHPVFSWGNGQSGTYLLYDLLALSEAFAYPSVTGWRKRFGKPHDDQAHRRREHHMGRGRATRDRVPVWMHDRVLTGSDMVNEDFREVRKRYSRLFATWPWRAGPSSVY